MLRGIERFFVSWRFAVFAISLLGLFALLVAALLWIPPAPSGLGAFAEDFRVWCFGAEGTADGASGLMRFAGLFELVSMAALIFVVWSGPIRAQLRSSARALLPFIAAAVAVVVGLAGSLWLLGGPGPDGAVFPARELRLSTPAPLVALIDHEGAAVSLQQLEGKVVLVTAVYARCGLACPMILGQAKRVVAGLGTAERAGVTVLGITLDPEHDTVEALGAMASAQRISAPGYHLLTGEPQLVNQALDAFGVERRRNPQTGVIDHANLFTLIDRQGRVAYRFTLGELQEKWMLSAVRTLLAEPPTPPTARRD